MSWEYALILIYVAFMAILDSGPPLMQLANLKYVGATAGQFNSLSLADIARLANDKNDHTSTIATFYEAKQRHFKFLVLAFTTVVLANVLAIGGETLQPGGLEALPPVYSYLGYLTGFLMGIISVLVYRLRKMPSEYYDAMLVYSALKQ